VTFLGSVLIGGMLTTVFLLSLGATGAYTYLLATAQKRVIERRTKVRHLPTVVTSTGGRVDFFAEDRSIEIGAEVVPQIRAVGSR
jgi:hypothetical protein